MVSNPFQRGFLFLFLLIIPVWFTTATTSESTYGTYHHVSTTTSTTAWYHHHLTFITMCHPGCVCRTTPWSKARASSIFVYILGKVAVSSTIYLSLHVRVEEKNQDSYMPYKQWPTKQVNTNLWIAKRSGSAATVFSPESCSISRNHFIGGIV